MRPVLAVVAGAATAALGAVILGEYQLAGLTGVVAGALFGLAVGEVTLAAGRERAGALVPVAAALTAAGMLWASWISAGRDWEFVPGGAWAGAAVGAVAAAWWVRAGARRAARTPRD